MLKQCSHHRCIWIIVYCVIHSSHSSQFISHHCGTSIDLTRDCGVPTLPCDMLTTSDHQQRNMKQFPQTRQFCYVLFQFCRQFSMKDFRYAVMYQGWPDNNSRLNVMYRELREDITSAVTPASSAAHNKCPGVHLFPKSVGTHPMMMTWASN